MARDSDEVKEIFDDFYEGLVDNVKEMDPEEDLTWGNLEDSDDNGIADYD